MSTNCPLNTCVTMNQKWSLYTTELQTNSNFNFLFYKYMHLQLKKTRHNNKKQNHKKMEHEEKKKTKSQKRRNVKKKKMLKKFIQNKKILLFQFQLIPTNGMIKITNQTVKLSIKISGEEQEGELKQSMPREYFKCKVSILKPNSLLTIKKKQ